MIEFLETLLEVLTFVIIGVVGVEFASYLIRRFLQVK